MQPELGSVCGEIPFLKTSGGKLEEINVSTEGTKNFNTYYSAGSLFFFPSRFMFLELEALKLVAVSNICMSLFSGDGVGCNKIP